MALIEFKNLPDTTTPLNAENLNNNFGELQQEITDNYNYLDTKIDNKIETYSTTETKTNKVWIDNRPIYRKVINIGNLPNTTTKTVAHEISNINEFVNVYGVASQSGGNKFPLPFVVETNMAQSIRIFVNSTLITIGCGIDRSSYTGYVILEYTKTTD